MKKIIVLIFFVLILTLSQWSDNNQNLLPLGKSPHKLKIGKISEGQLLDTNSNQGIAIDQIIKASSDTDVFMIGESHNSLKCHEFQRDFIEALHKVHSQIIVGFEFFKREDNPILEMWRLGQIEEDELLKRTGWYKGTGMNYGYTRLIMQLIRKHKIKAIGLNVSRKILRRVSRQGFESLSKDEKALFPTIDILNPEHHFFIKSIFGVFALQVPKWFEGVYSAQKCWDVIMAESMGTELKKQSYKNFKGVIIAGSNHVSFGLGIPFRYQLAFPGHHITTIVPIHISDNTENKDDSNPMMQMMKKSKPSALFSRGIADYALAIPGKEEEKFPVLGIQVKFKDGNMIVTRVEKDSLAANRGFQKGDKIISVDNQKIESVEQFRFILAQKSWDDSLQLKSVKILKLKKKKLKIADKNS